MRACRFSVVAAGQVGLIVLIAALLGISSALIRPDGIALIGNWADGAASISDTETISLQEARVRHQEGRALFVDARAEEEYQRGHIKGALSLPLAEAELGFVAIIEQLDASELVIAYCDGESCDLSHHLATFLREIGIAEVRVLVNGWTLWQQAGQPTSQGG